MVFGMQQFISGMIFSGMENANYFDKFMIDLEKRQDLRAKQLEAAKRAADMWEKRHGLDVRYREQAAERTRYEK